MSNKVDETTDFTPAFNGDGLIGCVVQSDLDGTVLMFAWLNVEALQKTLETGEMHYWSRSRQELWHKGATSGHIQKLISLTIDCDQDCLLARVHVAANTTDETACHTGRRSCFYREVFLEGEKTVLRFK